MGVWDSRADRELEFKGMKGGDIRKEGWRSGTREQACSEIGKSGIKRRYIARRAGSSGSRAESVGTRRPEKRIEESMEAEGSRAAGRWMRSRAGDGNQGRGD